MDILLHLLEVTHHRLVDLLLDVLVPELLRLVFQLRVHLLQSYEVFFRHFGHDAFEEVRHDGHLLPLFFLLLRPFHIHVDAAAPELAFDGRAEVIRHAADENAL